MELKELESQIRLYRKSYWEGNPIVKDYEYDLLIEELRKLDSNNALLHEIEHNEIKSKQVHHVKPMLSLDKVYKKEDLFKWIDKVKRDNDELFMIQPKYDGISCHYINNHFHTRGDGYIGEDISSVCQSLCEKEMKCECNDFYGEIVIKKSDFANLYANIYKQDGKVFKNPRNAVVGIVGTDDFEFYKNQNAKFTLIDYDKYNYIIKASAFINEWDNIKNEIHDLDYPMDGIVIKIADKNYAESLGYTAHHPKSAMAFKFENVQGETVLTGVDWGMGKENITATAVFEPVELNGVTVSRAVIPINSKTLPCILNGDFIIGNKLIVERAGDVIPHIIKVFKDNQGELVIINKCPFCGYDIEIKDSAICCVNDGCRKKLIYRLHNALVTLGVKNIGENTVDDISFHILEKRGIKISLENWIKEVLNFNNFENMKNIEGYGEISANNIINETKSVLKNNLSNFIAALCIPNVGKTIGNVLMKYDNIESILNLTEDEIIQLNGIGNIMAKRIYTYFQNHKNEILSLSEYFEFISENQKINNKKICFTGAMSLSRNEMSKIAQKAGFAVIDTVTKDLDVLVVADNVDLTSSKCKKAEKYGVNIIRENDFLNKYSCF